jgi:hypothetical protein
MHLKESNFNLQVKYILEITTNYSIKPSQRGTDILGLACVEPDLARGISVTSQFMH